jgi:hypothetical protein
MLVHASHGSPASLICAPSAWGRDQNPERRAQVFGELLDKLFAGRKIEVEHDTAWELHKADVEPSAPARSEEALRGANHEPASPVSEDGLHHAFSSSHSSFFGSPYHLPLAEGETCVDTTENTRKASEYETGRVLAHPEGIQDPRRLHKRA